MTIPSLSIFTLCTELLITAAIFFIIYRGYTANIFPRLFAFSVLGYEILFNISYMVSRSLTRGTEPKHMEKAGEIFLAIFHGIFSLFMFISLVIFFSLAARAYARGENYFRIHSILTKIFLIAWSISIISGIAFFARLYIL